MATATKSSIAPVVFLSRRNANTRFQIERETKEMGISQDGIPIVVPVAGKEKFAEFFDGICVAKDQRVVDWLDAHRSLEIYRADDPLADLRFTYGDDQVAHIEAAIKTKLAAQTGTEE